MRSSICTVTGAYSRWTIRSNSRVDGYYVYVGTSERTAGAIDSLVWRDKEFINNYDHGRQLQVHVKLSQRKCRLMHVLFQNCKSMKMSWDSHVF